MVGRIINFAKRKLLTQNQAPEPPNFGFKTGTNTKILRPRRAEGLAHVSFGNNSFLGKEAWIGAYDHYPNSGQRFEPEIRIGNNVLIGSFAMITCINKVIIEDFVEMADFVYISDHVHSITPEEGVPISQRRLVSRGYVKIGAYTAIGIHSTILPGVTLGKYCLVGANSVVTRSFPDCSIIMGNPATLMKTYSMETKKWIIPPKSVEV